MFSIRTSLTKSLIAFLTLILVMATPFAYPQAQTPQVETPQAGTPPTNAQQAAETAGAPVIFAGETLFSVYARIGPFSPAERASAISERMRKLSQDPLVRIDSITVADSQTSTDTLAGDIIIMTITDEDVKVAGLTRLQVAEDYTQKISAALKKRVVSTSLKSILLGILFTLLATAVLIFIFKVLNNVFPRVYAQLNAWRGTRIPSLRIQRLEILPADRITDILIGLVKVVRVALVLALLYFYLPLVFSFFPWTT